jgi:hypothetical protein
MLRSEARQQSGAVNSWTPRRGGRLLLSERVLRTQTTTRPVLLRSAQRQDFLINFVFTTAPASVRQ